MKTGLYPMSTNVGGNIPLEVKANAGFGSFVKASLGSEDVTQIGGVLTISYIGDAGLEEKFTIDLSNTPTGGKSFCFSTFTTVEHKWQPWFKVNGSGEAPVAQVGYTLKEIDITSYTDATLGTQIASGCNSEATVTYNTSSKLLTVINKVKAALTAPADVDTSSNITEVDVGRTPNTEDSCKIVVDATTITASIGDYDDEDVDNNFGTEGVVTLAEVDTLADLQEAIAGYIGYSATTLMGADDAATTTPIAITAAQAAGKVVYIYFEAADSGVYLHSITPDLSDAERPSYSIHKQGGVDNFLYEGIYVNELTLAGTLKAFVTGEVTLLGFTETTGQDETEIGVASNKTLTFQNGATWFNGLECDNMKQFNYKASNSMNAEGYGQGSINRQYVLKSEFVVTGDFTLRLDDVSYAERARLFNEDDNAALTVEFYGGNLDADMKEAMIIEMPYVQYSKFETPDSSGVLEAKFSYQLFDCSDENYDGPLTISIISTDSSPY